MRRKNKAAAIGAGFVVVVIGGIGCWWGWHVSQTAASIARDADVIELQIGMQCEGWSPENTEVGVFVSGAQIDGAPCDEQLVFEGSGTQIAYLSAGSYEVVPQLPMLMLVDGSVLAASEPIARAYADDASKADNLDVVYAAIDISDMTEDELRAAAEDSFLGEEEANAAFERALARGGGGVGHVEA